MTGRIFCVTDLMFGDSGKGTITDALTRELGASLIVRANGSAQAAHHVMTSDGRQHCFAQFGSGTLAGARTHLSRYMSVEPLGLLREAGHLEECYGLTDAFDLLTIDPDAPVITSYHRALNRLRERSRGDQPHGSCGIGAGELQSEIAQGREVLRWYMLGDRTLTRGWLDEIRARLQREAQALPVRMTRDVEHLFAEFDKTPDVWMDRAMSIAKLVRQSPVIPFDDRPAIFEGAQGVLLDQSVGFHPFTTWSACTFANADTLLAEHDIPREEVTRIGVLRSFVTRHGPGPLPTEDRSLRHLVTDDHNQTNEWQGPLRVGYFDVVLASYAVQAVGGVDYLALTHLDKVTAPWPMATMYHYRLYVPDRIDTLVTLDVPRTLDEQIANTDLAQQVTPNRWIVQSADAFLEAVATFLHTPIGIISRGPTSDAKQFLMFEVTLDSH